MRSWFNSRKAAQVAAFFAMCSGGAINILKLVKLIYLANRSFMEKYDCVIFNDRLVSMDHGPVSSITLNYLNGYVYDREDWKDFVSDRENYLVGLARDSLTKEDLDELSKAEFAVLKEVWGRFGHMDQWQICDWTHDNCPEWENPHGSSERIPYERVFKYLGKKHSDELAEKVESERSLDELFSRQM